MAITEITIKNFKGIADEVEIPIRPITLLFGKNSAGKSTVLQALRYVRNAVEQWIVFGQGLGSIQMSGGYNIDLSDFRSLVYKNNLTEKIQIRVEFDVDFDNKTKKATIEVETAWINEGPLTTYQLSLGKDVLINSDSNRSFYDLPIGREEETGENTRARVATLMVNLLKELRGIRHLGPIREVPSRAQATETYDEASWETGLWAWDALKRDKNLVQETSKNMQDVLNLGYSIVRKELTFISRDRSEILENLKNIVGQSGDELQQKICDYLKESPVQKKIELLLRDERNKTNVFPSDVGVGIAQVIPVVVGALASDEECRLFAVEQPELHVHPAVQVALGDVFINGMQDSNRTMLIETHSEHLMLRLLKRVRESSESSDESSNKLKPDDLSVVCVWLDQNNEVKFGSQDITSDGDFDFDWPEGFFPERLEELL